MQLAPVPVLSSGFSAQTHAIRKTETTNSPLNTPTPKFSGRKSSFIAKLGLGVLLLTAGRLATSTPLSTFNPPQPQIAIQTPPQRDFQASPTIIVGVDPQVESGITPEGRETFRRFEAFVDTYITPWMPFNQAGYSFGTSPDDESISFTFYELGPEGSGILLGSGQVSRHEMENDPEGTALRILNDSLIPPQ